MRNPGRRIEANAFMLLSYVTVITRDKTFICFLSSSVYRCLRMHEDDYLACM